MTDKKDFSNAFGQSGSKFRSNFDAALAHAQAGGEKPARSSSFDSKPLVGSIVALCMVAAMIFGVYYVQSNFAPGGEPDGTVLLPGAVEPSEETVYLPDADTSPPDPGVIPYDPGYSEHFSISIFGHSDNFGRQKYFTGFSISVEDDKPAFNADKITEFNVYRDGIRIECALVSWGGSRESSARFGQNQKWYDFDFEPRLSEPGLYTFRGVYDGILFGMDELEIRDHSVKCSSPCEVTSISELPDALRCNCETITIKSDLEIAERLNKIERYKTIVIDQNVTVTIGTQNFATSGQIINHGKIIVTGTILFYEEPLEIGNIVSQGSGDFLKPGDIEINVWPTIENILKYLSPDTIYTSVSSTPAQDTVLLIDRDITIPESKDLWLNSNIQIEVAEGVTLTVDGTVTTFVEPIIRGNVIGEIQVLPLG
jgi:hypothetical protein